MSSSFCDSASESCVYFTLPSTRVSVTRSKLSGVSVVASAVLVSTLMASCSASERGMIFSYIKWCGRNSAGRGNSCEAQWAYR